MKAKYVKYLVKGVQADAREKFDAELKKVEARSDLRYEWWQDEEAKRLALEKEVKDLKSQLEEMHNLVEGYKSSFVKEFGKEAENAEA